MNNDQLTALLSVGGFFVFLFCVFADGFIRQFVADIRRRQSDVGEWVFCESERGKGNG